ncbi:response regulator [Paenibacillus hodogayensis]|uniref:Response regulator n=1 Tax=Paenibacillus hodogayensis TaxID=279208 RepID=A0ABV5VZS8_9BACL
MYQLLVVDDEPYTAKTIEEGVSWERLGISTVHISHNIRRAKEIIENQRIDLMICDIEMPQGSGLELMEWVKEHAPSVVCIFLTCHADFKYAQRAIQLGSFEYLLKPIRFPELEEVAGKALGKIAGEREQHAEREKYLKYYEMWTSHEPVFIEHFWRDLLTEMIPSEPRHIREYLSKGNVPYDDKTAHLPVLVRIQRWHKELVLREEKMLEFALHNVMQELLGEYRIKGQLVQVNREMLVLIIPDMAPAPVGLEKLQQLLQHFIKASNEYLYCSLCCYIGETSAAHDMVGMYQTLVKMDADNIRLRNQVLVLPREKTPSRNDDAMPEPPLLVWTELLKQYSENELLSAIRAYLDVVEKDERLHAKWLREFDQNMLQIVYHFLHLKGLQAHRIFDDNKEAALRATRSVDDLFKWMQVLVSQSIRHAREAEKTLNVVEKVKIYIQANLTNPDLTRDEIAAHVYLNPDYLTRMFKKETGMAISDYVAKERMDLAKELLRKTNKSINTIAGAIGYSNFSNFARMFKKWTGLAPNEFRQSPERQS